MQVPVVKAAKAMGLTTLVMDKNPRAVAMAMADHPILADIADVDGAVEATRQFAKTHFAPDGALTLGTDFPVTSAAIAKAFGLPGISLETAGKAKDKIRMRECFRTAKCPQPDFMGPVEKNQLGEVASRLGFPMVVKPADSMGARGVRRVDDLAALAEAYDVARPFSPTGRVICENYIPGGELSIDAVVWKGEIMIRGIADRLIEREPYFIEIGHVLPSQRSKDLVEKACEAFRQGIRALGIETGWAKADIRINEKGAFIGEIAARLSGGFMSGYTYPNATGVNLMEGAIKIALGEHPGPLGPEGGRTSIERAILSKPGTIRAIEGLDRVRQAPGVHQVFLNWKVGDVVANPKNNVEKGGNIIVSGDTYGEASTRVEAALALLQVVVS